MLSFTLLLACTGLGEADAETPTVAFLSPDDGATVPAGEVEVSVVIENFLIDDPSKHSDGGADGWMTISVTQGDATEEIQTRSTRLDVTLVAGAATLGANLHFADGDEVGDEFADFEPASIEVTVE